MPRRPTRQANQPQTEDRTTGHWVMTLFALPFALVGLGMLFLSVLPTLYDWGRMQGWQPVQAQLLVAQLRVKRDRKSVSYRAQARYRYQVQGQSYTSERVAISDSSDGVGSFQQQLGQQLQQAHEQGAPVTAWVNPRAPHEAVLDRSLRLGLLALKLLFSLVFSAVGLGLLFFIWRSTPTEQNAQDEEDEAANRYPSADRGRRIGQGLGSTASQAPPGTALALEQLCQLTSYPGGVRLRQRSGRKKKPLLSLLVTGVAFVALSRHMRGDAPLWFIGLFGVVGTISALGALYRLGHSRHVLLGQQGLRVEHRLLGLPLHRKQWPAHELARLELHPSYTLHQGHKTTAYYHVQARLHSGNTVTLASALPSVALGQLLLHRLGREAGYPTHVQP